MIAKKIREQINASIELRALGNSTRSLRDVAVDLINASGMDWGDIAEGTFLCKSTIAKLAKDITRKPQLETVERILKFFAYRLDMHGEVPKGGNCLQPKK